MVLGKCCKVTLIKLKGTGTESEYHLMMLEGSSYRILNPLSTNARFLDK